MATTDTKVEEKASCHTILDKINSINDTVVAKVRSLYVFNIFLNFFSPTPLIYFVFVSHQISMTSQ